MADIPDYMRGFDLEQDWGMTPVSKPAETTETKVDVDMSAVKANGLEIAKIKSDVTDVKSMMNEIMQIVAEKETITNEISDEETQKRFKDIEKIVLPFLYNLSKSEEPYIHWPNRGPIIKAQIENILKLTRGK
jgi:hypothetical protein|tara:strand:- start:118 stop:516 length:399 start_codon:yes stop_codon:yes gene_type:complete